MPPKTASNATMAITGMFLLFIFSPSLFARSLTQFLIRVSGLALLHGHPSGRIPDRATHCSTVVIIGHAP